MKTHKILILFSLSILFSIGSMAQESSSNTKIYFLADTTKTPRESRFFSIGAISPFTVGYTFFCKCLPPYKNYIEFSYRVGKNIPKAPIASEKPVHKYTNWKELQELLIKNHKFFNKVYDLYIVEVLKDGRYKTNKVSLDIYDVTNDGVIIKDDKRN